MERAIARLGVIEYVLLGMAMVAALLGGALTGWLAQEGLGWSFRRTWTVSSLLYFVVPGGVSWWKARREARERAARLEAGAPTDVVDDPRTRTRNETHGG
jgi:uncharacterized membrane protein